MKHFQTLIVIKYTPLLASNLDEKQISYVDLGSLHIDLVVDIDHIELCDTGVDNFFRWRLHHVRYFALGNLNYYGNLVEFVVSVGVQQRVLVHSFDACVGLCFQAAVDVGESSMFMYLESLGVQIVGKQYYLSIEVMHDTVDSLFAQEEEVLDIFEVFVVSGSSDSRNVGGFKRSIVSEQAWGRSQVHDMLIFQLRPHLFNDIQDIYPPNMVFLPLFQMNIQLIVFKYVTLNMKLTDCPCWRQIKLFKIS